MKAQEDILALMESLAAMGPDGVLRLGMFVGGSRTVGAMIGHLVGAALVEALDPPRPPRDRERAFAESAVGVPA